VRDCATGITSAGGETILRAKQEIGKSVVVVINDRPQAMF